jgi:hypothetical protein
MIDSVTSSNPKFLFINVKDFIFDMPDDLAQNTKYVV